MAAMEKMLSTSPCSRTPLCAEIRAVADRVRLEATRLKAKGQRCLVVIASDGEASDGDVEEALKPLMNLPVWV